MSLSRSFVGNPIISPNPSHDWEALATFNPCVVKEKNKYHIVYRALSNKKTIDDKELSVSTIGYAKGSDKTVFSGNRLLVEPEYEWEKFGCEDPRITRINDRFYIFYTALSSFPPSGNDIKIALAITDDFKTIKKKCLVTPFNAKAMALFPKKINGKLAAVLTANTESPPAKIAISYFENENQICDLQYWMKWYRNIDQHIVNLSRLNSDQVEIGSPPIETKEGWLLIYAHIQNYSTHHETIFGIEAVLLDKDNPQKIVARTDEPILVPHESYELEGMVPNVIFPSGSLIENNMLYLYYGAADTVSALAMCEVDKLFKVMKLNRFKKRFHLQKYHHNPILTPREKYKWESKAVFNPAAVFLNNRVHLIYRALSANNTSVLGCASSTDGLHFKERLNQPIYVPKLSFEKKKKPNANSGCEDPRITILNNRLYMCYTAYDGIGLPKVAFTSILIDDFLQRRWNWRPPLIISEANVDDKNACLLSEKVNNKYVFFHRARGKGISICFEDDLDFSSHQWLTTEICIPQTSSPWEGKKIGLGPPPIKTKQGWLVLYHAVSQIDNQYRVGVMLLGLNDVSKIIARSKYPVLEPEKPFEKIGIVDNVVFPCGAVLIDDTVYVYYGGADKVICVATMKLQKILSYLELN